MSTTGFPFYLHCKMCLESLPPNTAPKDYANNVMAVRKDGRIMVECQRHAEPVVVLPEDVSEYIVDWLGFHDKTCAGCNHGETDAKTAH